MWDSKGCSWIFWPIACTVAESDRPKPAPVPTAQPLPSSGTRTYVPVAGYTPRIGPEHAKVGRSASAHEHGGRYKGQRYPKRPFMGPALETTTERLPRKWAGSVRT